MVPAPEGKLEVKVALDVHWYALHAGVWSGIKKEWAAAGLPARRNGHLVVGADGRVRQDQEGPAVDELEVAYVEAEEPGFTPDGRTDFADQE